MCVVCEYIRECLFRHTCRSSVDRRHGPGELRCCFDHFVEQRGCSRGLLHAGHELCEQRHSILLWYAPHRCRARHCIRQHTSAYVSMLTHAPHRCRASHCIHQQLSACTPSLPARACGICRSVCGGVYLCAAHRMRRRIPVCCMLYAAPHTAYAADGTAYSIPHAANAAAYTCAQRSGGMRVRGAAVRAEERRVVQAARLCWPCLLQHPPQHVRPVASVEHGGDARHEPLRQPSRQPCMRCGGEVACGSV